MLNARAVPGGAKGCIGAAAWPALIVKCAPSNHLNLKFSRLSSSIERQPISFMSRSISLWRF
jgi:hypothetical protein